MKTKQRTERSTPRKLADSSIVIKQPTYYLSSTLTSAAIGNVAFAKAYGLTELFDVLDDSVLDEFLKLRGVVDFKETEFVKMDASCHEFIEGMVYVKGLTKKTFNENYHYGIKIKNLELNNVPTAKKQISLYNLQVGCPCPRVRYVTTCRAPKVQRIKFGDYRTIKSNPGAFIESDLCKHSWIALNYLSMFYGTEDFGLFGLTDNAVGTISQFVSEVVRNGYSARKMSEYKLNEEYSMLTEELFGKAILGRF